MTFEEIFLAGFIDKMASEDEDEKKSALEKMKEKAEEKKEKKEKGEEKEASLDDIFMAGFFDKLAAEDEEEGREKEEKKSPLQAMIEKAREKKKEKKGEEEEAGEKEASLDDVFLAAFVEELQKFAGWRDLGAKAREARFGRMKTRLENVRTAGKEKFMGTKGTADTRATAAAGATKGLYSPQRFQAQTGMISKPTGRGAKGKMKGIEEEQGQAFGKRSKFKGVKGVSFQRGSEGPLAASPGWRQRIETARQQRFGPRAARAAGAVGRGIGTGAGVAAKGVRTPFSALWGGLKGAVRGAGTGAAKPWGAAPAPAGA